MHPLKSAAIAVALLAVTVSLSLPAQEASTGRSALSLENSRAVLVFDLAGGSLGDFHLKEKALNPFSWGAPRAGDKSIHGFGHFLCLDRWGPASDAESANGMPYHGEAPNVAWQLDQAPQSDATGMAGQMSAKLPLAGLRIERAVHLSKSEAFALVRETVSNQNKLGRLYNCVQHPTIGPPFLDATTVVDCNGRHGFAQGGPMPTPEEPSFYWPRALTRDGESVNVRHLAGNPDPNVVSYAIDEEYGWVTAATPEKGLLVGYLWRTSDYPWVSLWRDVRDGKPTARGLEFGTTGLHQPFPILVKKGRVFDRPTYVYLDAGEKVTRSYAVFLLAIPANYNGVESIRFQDGRLTFRERDRGRDRDLTLNAGLQF